MIFKGGVIVYGRVGEVLVSVFLLERRQHNTV
jgi:hypothetical protein